MRCFFNFKPKKSSSDIQQLIQFEEKIKRELKQQILQDLEAKPMATNKVAVEGIVETRVEKKKEKDNFWTLLGKWSRLFAAFSSISIVIAAISVYAYLADINSRHLLVNIISQPSFFLSVVISFVALMLIILIPVYIPFVIAGYITSELLKEGNTNTTDITETRKKAYNRFSLFSMVVNPVVMIILLNFYKQSLTTFFFFFMALFFIALVEIFSIKCIVGKYLENFDWFSRFTFGIFVFTINIVFLPSIIFALDISKEWFYGLTYYVYVVLFFIFVLMGYFLAGSLVNFGKLAEKKEDENKVKKIMWFIPLIIVIFFSLLSFMQEGAKFKQHLFQNLGYIETPEQARWYLLDKRYLEWNDINKNKNDALGPLKTNSLSLWRNKFKPLPKINVFSPNFHNNFYSYDYRYSNAFFGYMAWNLGESKIFCPQSVTLDKNVANNCLYIKSDYLQPIPEGV